MSWGGNNREGPVPVPSPSTESGVRKLHYIGIFKKTTDGSAAVRLCADAKLDEYGRFTKGSALEMLTLLARTTAKTSPDGLHQSVDLSSEPMFQGKPVKIHSWVRLQGGGGGQQQRIVGVAITEGWPKDVAAHQFIKKVVEDFLVATPLDAIDAVTTADAAFAMPKPADDTRPYLEIGQDPQKFDTMTQIQDQLDETKILLNKTIESVLQRGEKLDDLVAKSDNLSASSKMFYKQAKKQNSCCIVM